MTEYTSFDQLETEIRKLNLQRSIAKEQLKHLGLEVKRDLSSLSWIKNGLSGLAKYGSLLLIKKLFTHK